ncbi:MAG: circularly permuted type 2 ATP-grasp protein [Solirubrobacteraceae bacterium]|nr:circularly permuted type 2 ATP-grasp protein [Solirubrobacteraceae bacterium]
MSRSAYAVPPSGGSLDEAFERNGARRPLYDALLSGYADADLAGRADQVTAHLAERGVAFGGAAGGWPFVVDQVPRLIEAAEWAHVDAGLQRRAATLEAFVADMHGERACITDGIVPPDILAGCPFHEPDLDGLPDPATARIAIAGMDLVRDGDGELLVLEDNCRTPSGLAYALAARDAVRSLHGDDIAIRDYRAELQATLRQALTAALPPNAADGGEIVLMSDGQDNTAWYEHNTLAALADVDLLVTEDVRLDGTQLRRRSTGAPIAVVYRRTDIDRLRSDDGSPTSLGELFVPALQAGTLSLLNAFGTGVADDKRVHAHVDDLTTYYLGEPPIIRSVPTLDLSEPAALDEALDRAGELVFKPRDGHGGYGVVIGPAATPAQLDALRAEVRAAPAGWIAQDVVALSTHPTVIDGVLSPRHVDLRPFALATGPRQWAVLPGGLTRVALAAGELVVNSSRGGGGKDTWVLTR